MSVHTFCIAEVYQLSVHAVLMTAELHQVSCSTLSGKENQKRTSFALHAHHDVIE